MGLNLRTAAQTAAGVAPTGSIAPGPGRMPLPIGTVMTAAGEPVARPTAQQLLGTADAASYVAASQAPAAPAVPANYVPPKPQILNLSDLPPEKQRELTQAVQDMAPAYKSMQSVPQAQSPYLPELNQILAERAQQMQMPQAALTPALSLATPPAPPPQPQPVAQPPAPAALPPGLPSDYTTPPEITPDDKRAFLIAALSMGDRRFEKEYRLYDGDLTMRFRWLSSAESEMIFTQLGRDAAANKFGTAVDYLRWFDQYRMAISLSQLITPQGQSIQIPPIKEITFNEPGLGETVLPQLFDYIQSKVLPSEALFQIALTTYKRFQGLCVAIMEKAHDTNFSQGTS